MAEVRNRFKNLLAQLEVETGERPTYEVIKQATGIATSTLSDYANNRVKYYADGTLKALIDYFDERLEGGCTVADFLEYPPAVSQETPEVEPTMALA
jgi:hypothetical protein